MRNLLMLCLIAIGATFAVSAQQPSATPRALSEAQRAESNGRELFERARMLEESNNKLADAIALYTQVASQSSDRRLAATAHLRAGLLHERLGQKDDAVKAFTTVARDYADQPQLADRARARLATLPLTRPAGSQTASRLVWSGHEVDTQGSVSPDGRYISYVERGLANLAVYNVATRTSSRITDLHSPGSQLAMGSRIASDSRQVVFAWLTEGRVVELRTAQIGRPGVRTIYRNPEFVPDPFGWSADGRRIFAVLEGRTGSIQIAELPAAGGDVRVLKTFDWRFPDASLSPDGKWIAYAIRSSDAAAKGDLFLLAVDGSIEVPIDRHAADDASPIWAPDGSGVVFVSDRGGALDLWFIPVAGGRPQGPARMVKQNVGRGRPLGFAPDGKLFYGTGKGAVDVYVGSIDLAVPRASAGLPPVTERFVGGNYAPDWSPDGTRLIYVSVRTAASGGGAGKTIVVRSMADGRERDLTPRLQYFHRPRWAPDGRTIVAQGKGLAGPAALFAIDPEDGSASALVKGDGERFPAFQTWSRDGSTLFYSENAPDGRRIIARDMASGVGRAIHDEGGGEKAASPDGKWVAIVLVMPDAPSTIRLVPAAGGPARDLVVLHPPDRVQYFGGLSWTPDGKGLLFVKESGDRRELCHVDVATGRIAPTGLAPAGLTYVRLHPDGRQIAYSAGTREEEVWVIENFLPPAATSRR